MKKLIVILILLSLGTLAVAAPIYRVERSILPETDSAYYLGSTTPSTVAWKGIVTDQLCLNGDCQTAWPSGSSLNATSTEPLMASWFVATSTTATSSLPLLTTTAISIAGEYISNFTNYVRSLFTESTGIDISSGAIAFDSTEIAGTTWGAAGASSFSWIFDLTSNDPSLTFSGNAITAGAQTLSVSNATPILRITDSTVGDDDYSFQANSSALTITNLTDTVNFLSTDSSNNLTLGAAGVPAITLTTDSTGNAEVVLPDGAIGSTEILDGDILEADLKVVDSPADEDIFTFESTTGDFEWHTGAQLCVAITGSAGLCDGSDDGGGGSSGNVATSTSETANNVAYWTSTASTPATLGSDAGMSYNAGTDGLTVGTLDTGQGANELYDMDQNVLTTSDVTFNRATTTTSLSVGGTYYVTGTSTAIFSIDDLAAGDDNRLAFTFPRAGTFLGVKCRYEGTGTTLATFSFEDTAGNAVTSASPTCVTGSTNATTTVPSAANTFVEGEGLRFDISNTPSPVTDDYQLEFLIGWTASS